MLEIKNLNVYYGPVHVLKSVNLKVPEKGFVTLIGANGAGKTTLLKTISGLIKLTSGEIIFKGEDITKLDTNKIVEKGIMQVPEGRGIFPRLTVLENLKMGAYLRKDSEKIKKDLEYVYEKFPRLKERQKQLGESLSGGEQQMLAIGRALMSKPEMILFDEPSMGLAPILVQKVANIIRQLHNEGITILLVEQNANIALKIAKYGYVLQVGEIVLADKTEKLLTDEKVKRAYLGDNKD